MSHVTTVDDLEAVEDRLLKKQPKEWRKAPDLPLAKAIERSQRWSILREGRKKNGLNTDDSRLDEIN